MEMTAIWNFLNDNFAEIFAFIAIYIIMSKIWKFQSDVVSILKTQNKILENHFSEIENPGNRNLEKLNPEKQKPRFYGILKAETREKILGDKPIS